MWFRDQPITITPLVVQLVTLPIGRFMEKIIPSHPFFNPGRFNMKEHVLIVTMVNACYQTAYAIDIVTVQKIFYGQDLGWGGGFLLVLTTQVRFYFILSDLSDPNSEFGYDQTKKFIQTDIKLSLLQCIGYGLAGVLRPFLVYPAAMVWPGSLVNIAMFRSFHVPESSKGMTRIKWFLMIGGISFIWYWIPGYLVSVLSIFSWACWIAPNNIILGQLTGGNSGLSMLALTFDWTVVTSYLGNPLIVPAWVHLNVLAGFVLVAWMLVPALYYTNVWNAQAYPILTPGLFTVDGAPYDKSKIINADITFNETAYEAYGPLRLSSFFAITYGIGFASLTAILVHGALWNGKEIIEQWKRSRTDGDDIHTKLMRNYPEVSLPAALLVTRSAII